jgi:AAA+ superfamily predicted ATPase
MSYSEQQVRDLIEKCDEFHKHSDAHWLKIIEKYQADLAIAVEALERIVPRMPRMDGMASWDLHEKIAYEALAKIRSMG